MKRDSDDTKPNSRFRFTVNQLLLATAALAIPMAMLSNYWLSVNDTVDYRTIPFSDAGAKRQAYLIGGMILLGISAAFFIAVLLRRRLFFGAALFTLSLLVSVVNWSKLGGAKRTRTARSRPGLGRLWQCRLWQRRLWQRRLWQRRLQYDLPLGAAF